MEETKSEKTFSILVIISLIIFALAVGSYALWQITKKQDSKNIVGTSCLHIELENESAAIDLGSAYPISDSDGLELDPFTFTITNNCDSNVNYLIGLESIANPSLSDNDYLKYDYVRLQLDDENPVNYGSLEELSSGSEEDYTIRDSREIIHYTLKGNGSVTHRIRLWIDENTPLKNEDGTDNNDKYFYAKIRILAGQGIEGGELKPMDPPPTPTDESCFTFKKSSQALTYYDSSCGGSDVVIPSEIDGVEVVKILATTFRNKGLTSVFIPYTVQSITSGNTTLNDGITVGNGAFTDNPDLMTVIFEDTVKHPSRLTAIGDYAFYNDQVRSVTIPGSVETIGKGAFYGNKITDVVIKEGVDVLGLTESCGTEICGAFATNEIVNVTLPSTLTVISQGVFRNNKISSITIPSNVTKISKYAFYDNAIREITIPANVKTIEDNAFKYNNFFTGEDIIIENNETNLATRFDSNWLDIGFAYKNPSLADCFAYSGDMIIKYNSDCGKEVIIPSEIAGNTIKSIGEAAFNKSNITSVEIPFGVTIINNYAFSGNKLMNVVIPSNVTMIGQKAFSNNRLTNVTIPSSVTTIRSNSFSDNQIESLSFENTTENSSQIKEIEAYAFFNNRLTVVTIPPSVTRIGTQAFRNNQIESLTLENTDDQPSRLTTIDQFSFFGNMIKNLSIPPSVTTIGPNAFKSNQLGSLTFENTDDYPSHITTINQSAFENNQLTSVDLPWSLTTISQMAFYKNSLSGTLVISNNVNNIGAYAFGFNPNLSTIVVKRQDSTGLTLGTNWNGSAQVVYDSNYNN